MNLDLQLILTHIVGFLITVWILKKFAWKPILGIMQERRQKIKAEFDTIERQRAEAATVLAEYQARLKDIEVEARQKIAEAIHAGNQVAAEIREHGREEAKEIINRAKAELDRDVAKARVELKEEIVDMTIAAAEKIITTRLSEPEHRRLVAEFIDTMEKA